MSLGQVVGGVIGGAIGFYLGGPMGAMMGASLGAGLGGLVDPLDPEIPSPGQPEIADLDVTTATEGLVLPDFVGTTKLAGNIFWYDGDHSKEVTEKVKTGKGGSSSQKVTVGIEYFLSWAVGLCVGPVDELYSVYRNDNLVWSGNLLRSEAVDGASTITLNGMGSMTFYFGGTDQLSNATMANFVGDDTNPSMRGLAWAFFDDNSLGDYNRAPTIRFVMRKTPAFAFSAVHVINTYDYNPAHALWYILTQLCELDSSWLDSTAFATFATAVNAVEEKRGIGVTFKHGEAKAYIDSILMHVNAIMPFSDSGKFAPLLLRNTISATALTLFTDEDALSPPKVVSNSYMDTFNDVKVQYSQIYNFETGESIAADCPDPDDPMTGSASQVPNAELWGTFNIPGLSDTTGENPPMLDGNELHWNASKVSEGSGEEVYRVISRGFFTSLDHDGTDYYIIEITMDYSTFTTVGDAGYGFTPLAFGVGTDYGDDDNPNRDLIYIQRFGNNDDISIYGQAGVATSSAFTLLPEHFPITVRLRREDHPTPADGRIRTGFMFFNNVTGQWQDFNGATDTWWFGGYESDWAGFVYMQYSTQSVSQNTSNSFEGGFSDYSIIDNPNKYYCFRINTTLQDDSFTPGAIGATTLDEDKWNQGGAFRTQLTAGGIMQATTANNPSYQIGTKCALYDDFDMQWDYDLTRSTWDSNYNATFTCNFIINLQYETNFIINSYRFGSPYYEFYFNIKRNGATTSTVWRVNHPVGKVKITRVSDTIKFYFWGYPLAGWNLVVSYDNFRKYQGFMYFGSNGAGPHYPYREVIWDNFKLNESMLVGTCIDYDATQSETTATAIDIRQAAVHAEDPANKEVMNRIRHTDIRMMLYTNDDNARWAAANNIRMASVPLRTLDFPMNRRGATLVPGDLFRYTSDKYGINESVFRLLAYKEGSIENEEIVMSAIEDANYISSLVVVDEADRGGTRRYSILLDVVEPQITETPYALVGENMYLVPLITRQNGQETGVVMYMSLDGTSYTELTTLSTFAVGGSLTDSLEPSDPVLDDTSELKVNFYYERDAFDRIETIGRGEMIAGGNLALLKRGTQEEIISIQTATPATSAATGQYVFTNLYRGRYDTEQYSWVAGDSFYFLGSNPAIVETSGLSKGMIRYFKFIYFNAAAIGDISEATAVALTITGRAWTPYKPKNLRANGLTTNSPGGCVYSSGITLTWDPRIRGEGAGLFDPDTVVDTYPTYEGFFDIDAVTGSGTAFTDRNVAAMTAAYTEGQIANWNGGTLPSWLTFHVSNNITTRGVKYNSVAETLTVTKD